jgi:hypothetical protein
MLKISGVGELWEGAELAVVVSKDLPKSHRRRKKYNKKKKKKKENH